MKRLVLPLIVTLIYTAAAAQSPGGVSSGLAIWLKADAGTSSTSNGAFLSSWNDQSGNGVNATQTDPTDVAKPRYILDAINGNPAIQFTGGDKFFNINLSSLGSAYTIITVAERADAAANRYVIGVQSLTPRGLHLGYALDATLRLGENASGGNANATVSGYNASTEAPRFIMGEVPSADSRTVTEINNGVTVSATNSTTITPLSKTAGVIGRGFTTGGFSGYIAEVICYNRILSAAEKNQIITYLAVKYGFTIDLATHDYYGQTGFEHDVFGIGNATSQGLNQTASRSENPDDIVRISNPSSLGNGDYLIVGNNNGAKTFGAYGGSGCGISTILGRRWKVNETGEAGSVSLSFDITGFTTAPEDIVLMVDNDNDGYDDEGPIAGVFSDPYLTFSNINLANNAEFTLGEGTATWYSRASGNTTDAIWSKTIDGTPTTIPSFCSAASIVVQTGHTVINNVAITARNFTIQSGATFVQNTTALNLHGTYLNSGTHTITTGDVNFNGLNAQTITGATITDFYNVNCNNAAGVSIAGLGMEVHGVLQVNAGTFSTNGKLTLPSFTSYTGSIGPLTTGDVIGNVRVERNHIAADAGWVNIGAPVSGRTVSDWNDDMITTGFTGSDFPSYSFNNIQYYNETVAGNRNQGYVGVASIAENLVTGRGYFIYMNEGNLPLDLEGPINKGNISLPVTFTNTGNAAADGWCLVANPYPSAIDWDAAGWTKTNMANAVYVYDQAIGQFASYINGVGTNGGSGIVPSSQSFFVQANGASPALNITESVKTAQSGTFKSKSEAELLTLKMTINNRIDESIIVWESSATENFNSEEDASKLKSPKPEAPLLCSISNDGFDVSINAFPSNKENAIIPLRVESSEGGKTTLEWAGTTAPNGETLLLQDTFTGMEYDMSAVNKITVDIEAGNTEARFFIKKKSDLNDAETALAGNVTGYMNPQGMVIQFNYNQEHRFKITAYTMLGQVLVAPFEGTYSNQAIMLSDPRYAMNALVDVINMDTGERTTIRIAQ